MGSQKSKPEIKQSADAPARPKATSWRLKKSDLRPDWSLELHLNLPKATSCRAKKNEEAPFLVDFKDLVDEFVNASMDEHKECLKNTVKKMFSLSKRVAEKKEKNYEQQEVESILPLQTAVSN